MKCRKCKKCFSLRKGTIFDSSRLPLRKWFTAIYLINSSSKGIDGKLYFHLVDPTGNNNLVEESPAEAVDKERSKGNIAGLKAMMKIGAVEGYR